MHGKDTIYLSFPITGFNLDERLKYSEKIEKELSVYFNVINPLKNGIPWEEPKEKHMKKDLHDLLECDAIFLCEGYIQSEGCCIEERVAKQTGKRIIEELPEMYLSTALRFHLVEGIPIGELVETFYKWEMLGKKEEDIPEGITYFEFEKMLNEDETESLSIAYKLREIYKIAYDLESYIDANFNDPKEEDLSKVREYVDKMRETLNKL